KSARTTPMLKKYPSIRTMPTPAKALIRPYKPYNADLKLLLEDARPTPLLAAANGAHIVRLAGCQTRIHYSTALSNSHVSKLRRTERSVRVEPMKNNNRCVFATIPTLTASSRKIGINFWKTAWN